MSKKTPRLFRSFWPKKEVLPTYTSPVADAPGGGDGALSEVAGLDVGGLCARTVDHVLVPVLVVVLPGVNLTAGNEALPVSLPTRDRALRAEEIPVSTTCCRRAAQNGRGGNQACQLLAQGTASRDHWYLFKTVMNTLSGYYKWAGAWYYLWAPSSSLGWIYSCFRTLYSRLAPGHVLFLPKHKERSRRSLWIWKCFY